MSCLESCFLCHFMALGQKLIATRGCSMLWAPGPLPVVHSSACRRGFAQPTNFLAGSWEAVSLISDRREGRL